MTPEQKIKQLETELAAARSKKEHDEWFYDHVIAVNSKLMQLHEELCPDYFPDWNNSNEIKYRIEYSHENDKWIVHQSTLTDLNTVYFTQSAAAKAAKKLNNSSFMISSKKLLRYPNSCLCCKYHYTYMRTCTHPDTNLKTIYEPVSGCPYFERDRFSL